jgi:N-acetylneuraminic acid mutarotase
MSTFTNQNHKITRTALAFSTRILCVPVLAATLLLLPSRTSAQSATVTDDAFLSTNSTTQQVNLNGQGISLLVAGSNATVGSAHLGATKTFIRFQLQSSLPPGVSAANVAKATLKLFVSPGIVPTGTMDLYTVTGDWNEATLNPSSPPAISSSPFLAGIALGKANSFLVVDVTQLVQSWLKGAANGGLENRGIALVASTSTTYVVFDSKESIVTSHEPRLEIVLASDGPAGAAATIQVGSTITLGPGGQASVTNTGTPNAAVLNFSIPQGPAGANGQTGSAGQTATVQVGTTMTVPAGTPASVLNGGTQNAAVLNFLIPQGPSGLPGLQGPQGPAGINNKGNWNGTTAYNPSEAVFASGSYWLATVANTNSQPSATNTAWQLLAAGINNRGTWDKAVNYNANDAVSDSGSYWLALAANNTSQPSGTNSSWQLLAAQGAKGTDGSAGASATVSVGSVATGLPGSAAQVTNTGSSQNAVLNFTIPQGPIGPQGMPGQNPVSAALTTTSNTFAGNQTINGSLILGNGGGVQFSDGTVQTSASIGGGGGIPAGYMITGTTPVAPPGYTLFGSFPGASLWTSMAPMPTARIGLAAAAVNGKIYAIGGIDSGAFPVNTVEVYNPSSNSWSAAAAMPTARAYLATAAANGKIYAIGGFDNNFRSVNNVEVYDPSSNSWSTTVSEGGIFLLPLAPMPTARFALAAAGVNGKIYAIGGSRGPGILNTVEVYDPSSNSWSTAAGMPTARQDLATAAVNGIIYAIGGFIGGFGNPLSKLEVYDPNSNSWSTAASMPTARENLAAAAINDKIYAIGGLGFNGTTTTNLNTVDAYDPSSNSWSTAISMPTARHDLAATDANGLIYAVGGNNGFVLNATEQFSTSATIYIFIKN